MLAVTSKKGASRYTKEYIGQSAQHALWAEKRYPNAQRLLYIVGPRVAATPQETPPAGLRVVMREELARVADVLLGIYRRAADVSTASCRPNSHASDGDAWYRGRPSRLDQS